MTSSTRSVRDHLASLEVWNGADVERMPVDEALAACEAGAQALNALQGVVSRFAARVDTVCEQSPGVGGYARRHGYASGPALLAARSGLAPGEVNRLASLGHALLTADAGARRAEREALPSSPSAPSEGWVASEAVVPSEGDVASEGEAPQLDWETEVLAPEANVEVPIAPPRELAPGEYLAREVDGGKISPAHAEVISATLADFTIDSRDAEREFVDYARHVGLRKLKSHCFWRLGELDPAGLALREARQRRERFLSITDGPDGMVTIYGKLDVVAAAAAKTLLDTMTSSALRRQRKLPFDQRLKAGQLCADALADICLHATGCTAMPTRPKSAYVVRINQRDIVNDLREMGLVDAQGRAQDEGVASCDGILQPITAATARLMAVDAQLLPQVMGGESLPLDLGRANRLFTKAQGIAITERDRGCIRCTAPPAFCHRHHIKFWSDDGPSDLANAVTLCSGCHHRLHEQRWELVAVGDRFEVRELDPDIDPDPDPESGVDPDPEFDSEFDSDYGPHAYSDRQPDRPERSSYTRAA